MHRDMLAVRHAEETLARRYLEQEMRTPAHFGIGQEAVAVGVCRALRSGDVAYSHHRCHNHYLAMGGDLFALAAELYGREAGCARGRGGSVHLTAPGQGFMASTAILGETIACAVGAALAFKMDARDSVAATFFGDAACEEGIFYECLNYASIHRLPVVFVCENNLYSTESPRSVRQPPGTALTERAAAFKVEVGKFDGNDVASVYTAAAVAVARARSGRGPTFLEFMTYRWREHVGPKFDHELGRTYRPRDEVEAWMARCPIQQSAERLTRQGVATSHELASWSREIAERVEADVERARQAPPPSPTELFRDVY
jgi:pyruvate dehydrogenase E1 component alpha subunit